MRASCLNNLLIWVHRVTAKRKLLCPVFDIADHERTEFLGDWIFSNCNSLRNYLHFTHVGNQDGMAVVECEGSKTVP